MRRSIRNLAQVALAIGVVALVVAGCGGGDDEVGAASAGTGIVSVASVDGTEVLADVEGRTLYTAPVEEGGIRCVEACTSFWEPVTATDAEAERAAADLDLDLGIVERPEGDRQLTLDRLPLYTFTEEDAGQLEGDGFVDDFQGTRFEWEAASIGGGSPSPGSDSPGGTYDY